jgi:hypothetical protein
MMPRLTNIEVRLSGRVRVRPGLFGRVIPQVEIRTFEYGAYPAMPARDPKVWEAQMRAEGVTRYTWRDATWEDMQLIGVMVPGHSHPMTCKDWYMDKRRAHALKTDPAVFEATRLGLKTCEVRLDDRDYMIGDVLVLRETMHSADAMRREGWPLAYTGRTLTRVVSHVLVGYGLQEGYVALSFAPADGVNQPDGAPQ